jgi:hypothetical protein
MARRETNKKETPPKECLRKLINASP